MRTNKWQQHRVTGSRGHRTAASMCTVLSGKPHSPTRAVFSPLDSFYFECFGQAWADTVFLRVQPCISLTGIGLLTLDPEPSEGTCKQGTATNHGDFTLTRQGVEQGDYPGLRYQQSHGGTQRPLVGWGSWWETLYFEKVPKDDPITGKCITNKHNKPRRALLVRDDSQCPCSPTVTWTVHTFLIGDEVTLCKRVHPQALLSGLTSPARAPLCQVTPKPGSTQLQRPSRQAKARASGQPGCLMFEDMGLLTSTSLGGVLHI